ncbi:MAG TPA: M14 family zinc carboxypeptidase, partial [Chloroflexota bacterium]|nr:M14 family zinc carboxypeptidase [Chloroflexota bacterium]
RDPSCPDVADKLYSAYLSQAAGLLSQDQTDLAIGNLDKAVQLVPGRGEAAVQRRELQLYRDGTTASKNGDLDQAIARLGELVQTDREYASGRALSTLYTAEVDRAQRYADANRLSEALKQAQDAAALKPTDDRAQSLVDSISRRLTPTPAPTNTPVVVVAPPQTNTGVSASSSSIGKSVDGRDIAMTRVGSGAYGVAIVGNYMGAWDPSSNQTVAGLRDYFRGNPGQVPANVSLYFIPTINPDALENGQPYISAAKGDGGPGDIQLAHYAFNSHAVDLNRNFPIKWSSQPCGGERYRLIWGVGCHDGAGGPGAFSEPETRALRDFLLSNHIRVVLNYFENRFPSISIRNGGGGNSEGLARALESAVGIKYVPNFPDYALNGQVQDWIDGQGMLGADIEVRYRQPDAGGQIAAVRTAMQYAIP